MTPDHVRGRLSSDAGVTSSSIISPTIPSPISTLSTAPFMMLSPASTTSDNLIHRRFPYGLLRIGMTACVRPYRLVLLWQAHSCHNDCPDHPVLAALLRGRPPRLP